MKQKLHSLLLLVVLLSWSIAIAASDFDDGILKYTITSPENLEVKCDGFTDAHKNDDRLDMKKAWELYLLPVPRSEAFALPCVVERATSKPTPICIHFPLYGYKTHRLTQ